MTRAAWRRERNRAARRSESLHRRPRREDRQ